MELTGKQKILIVLVYTAGCVALGYYLTPEKVKIVKEEVSVEDTKIDKKESVDTDVKKNKTTRTTIVEETLPDGTKRKTTTVDSKTDTDKSTKKDVDTKTETVKTDTTTETETRTKSSDHLSLSLIGAVDITNPNGIIYGGHVQKNLLGPVTIGVFGLSNGVAGCSVGLTF